MQNVMIPCDRIAVAYYKMSAQGNPDTPLQY